jgi:hypothetical protein
MKQVVARVGKTTPASEASPPAAIDPQPRLIFPDELLEANEAPSRAGDRGAGRALRTVGYVALGALAGIGAWTFLTTPLASHAPSGSVTAQPAEPAPEADPALVSNAVAEAVTAFDLRVRMFESHQMQCADLSRGLVLVEERWTEYSTGHRAVAANDSSAAAADRALYASVDQVERRFERSGCARP